MCRKIAVYVEGQTEQILINQLILIWWSFSNIKIDNIKLKNDLKNPVHSYNSGNGPDTHFVIINIEGMGHLPSAISQRAEKQIENGFDIIGLRDLDYENFKHSNDQIELIQKFKSALKIAGCQYSETIELYFAIVTIEAWMLAFQEAVSKWAEVSEKEVLDAIEGKNCKLEQLRSPSSLLALIGKKGAKDPKTYHEIKSFASGIDLRMIHKVYQSKQVPSFNKFWEKLTSEKKISQ